MKNIIESTINWSKIGKHSKTEYLYSIEKAVVSKETAVLSVNIRSNFIFPFEDVDRISKLILNEVSGLKKVSLVFFYEDVILTKEEIIKLYIPYLIENTAEEFTFLTKSIFPDQYVYIKESNSLTLMALGDTVVKALNDKVKNLFKRELKEKFDIDLSLEFENHRENYKEIIKEKKINMAKEIEELDRQQKAAAGNSSLNKPMQGNGGGLNGNGNGNGGNQWQRREKETPMVGNRVMGKNIGDEPIPLSHVTPESGTVTVEGMVFRKDQRTIKNNKRLVTILITDKSTSLCVKSFVSETKWEEIDKNVKNGQYIKVRGNAEFDLYEQVVTVMVKDLELIDKKLKTDDAQEKRVELHAHTKMSAMDGLADVADLVKNAAKWGHKAVAITDHGVVQSFPDAAKTAKYGKLDIKLIYGVEGYLFDDSDGEKDYKSKDTNHIVILAQTQEGLKNLYRLVSLSHLNYFYKRPRIPKSLLTKHREGLLLGSACEAGEVYNVIAQRKSKEEIIDIINYYDYLEIQPLCNNQFLIDKDYNTPEGKKVPNCQYVDTVDDLIQINKQIIEYGKELGKIVVATCDAHYINQEEAIYRKILMSGQGYDDADKDQRFYFRTTEEMLEEFNYLGKDLAYEVVVKNTNTIADMIEKIYPVPEGKFPPKLENADVIMRNKCMDTAHKIYGEPLPERIKDRLEREMNSIINNGYAVMYVSAEMLVNKSMQDGYLVGSRGSVGSSFAATMGGITEVNPLPPHYICPNPECKNLEWGNDDEYDCGVDLPDKTCPKCGTLYKRDGFNIPFEVFLGFEGDKEPDIDLNFAGEYQATAHKYVDEIFGKKNVFKAGTIGTIANKTAYGFVKKYFEERMIPVNKFEVDRLSECCSGVRRTTGQHPGGIIVVPDGHEIYEFCPVQHPANDMKTDIITTHFDFHSIDENLLKLDILGHDVPSMIRHLQDMTGVDPLEVPLRDEKVNSLFNGIEGLDIKSPDYKATHGTYGIPEFGTKFVRQMLDDVKPSKFADLVRISGFSHGTDVWINNAQEFIKSGVATIKDAISTRDDIMNYLIHKGVPNKNAFKIMENVRKGKGITAEEAELMEENDVPEWYIESCRRIKYMFPKAHAVAYVMMSYRIAYYKVYHPPEFYAVYFTTKAADFNAEVIFKGFDEVTARMRTLEIMGKNATAKEINELTVLEVALEMLARGYEFVLPELGVSHPMNFKVVDGKVILPFVALSGVGETAAKAICEEFEVKPFISKDDLRVRAKANKTAIEALDLFNILKDLPDSDQLSLF